MEVLVYKATTPSGKSYIGITSKSFKTRICQHYSKASKGSSYKFHKAVRKYGKSIDWTILTTCNDWNIACDLEKQYITEFDTYRSGYNATLGGDGVLGKVFKHTKAAKKKISENHYRKYNKFNHSPESRIKIGLAGKGRVDSSATKDKKSLVKGATHFTVHKNGEYVGEWFNRSQCARDLDLDRRSILRSLKGEKYYSSVKGYTFKSVGVNNDLK